MITSEVSTKVFLDLIRS